jgi:hypothetical protein
VAVSATAANRQVQVVVRVSSVRGVKPTPGGRVVVKLAGHRAVVHLRDGRGTATFGAKRPLKRGRYWVKARYLGGPVFGPDRAVVRVRVRRG